MSRDSFVVDENVFSLDEIRVIAELVAIQAVRMGELKSILALSLLARGSSSSDGFQRALTQYYKPELSDVLSFVFHVFDLSYFPDENELKVMLFEKIAELNLSQAIHSRFKPFFLSDTTEQIIQLAADLERVMTNRAPRCALANLKVDERRWVKEAITLSSADFIRKVGEANDDEVINTLFLTDSITCHRPEFHAELFATWRCADVIEFYEQLNPASGDEEQTDFKQMQIERYRAFKEVEEALCLQNNSNAIDVIANEQSAVLLPDRDSLTDTYVFQNQMLSMLLSICSSDSSMEGESESVIEAFIRLYQAVKVANFNFSVQFMVEALFDVRRFDLLAALFVTLKKSHFDMKSILYAVIHEAVSISPSVGYIDCMNTIKLFYFNVLSKDNVYTDMLAELINILFTVKSESISLVLVPFVRKILQTNDIVIPQDCLQQIAENWIELVGRMGQENYHMNDAALLFPLLLLNKKVCATIVKHELTSFEKDTSMRLLILHYVEHNAKDGCRENLKNIISFLFIACQIALIVDHIKAGFLDIMLRSALDKIEMFPEQERREFAEDILINLISFLSEGEIIKMGFNGISIIWRSFYQILAHLRCGDNEIVSFENNKMNQLIMAFNNLKNHGEMFCQFGSMEIAFYQGLQRQLKGSYLRDSKLHENIMMACKCGVFMAWKMMVKNLSEEDAEALFYRGVRTDHGYALPIIFGDTFDPYNLSESADAAFSLILSLVSSRWMMNYLDEHAVYQPGEIIKPSDSASLYLNAYKQDQLTHFHYFQASMAIPSVLDYSSPISWNLALLMNFIVRDGIEKPFTYMQYLISHNNQFTLSSNQFIHALFQGVQACIRNIKTVNSALLSRLTNLLVLEIQVFTDMKSDQQSQLTFDLMRDIASARTSAQEEVALAIYNKLELICFCELSERDKERYLVNSNIRATLFNAIKDQEIFLDEFIERLDEFGVQQLFFRGEVKENSETLPLVFSSQLSSDHDFFLMSKIHRMLLSRLSYEWLENYLLEEKTYLLVYNNSTMLSVDSSIQSMSSRRLRHYQYFNLCSIDPRVGGDSHDEFSPEKVYFYHRIYEAMSSDFLEAHLFRRDSCAQNVLTDLFHFLLSLDRCMENNPDALDNLNRRLTRFCQLILSDVGHLPPGTSDSGAALWQHLSRAMDDVMVKIKTYRWYGRHLSICNIMRQFEFDLYLNLPYRHQELFAEYSHVRKRMKKCVESKETGEHVFFTALRGLHLTYSAKNRLDKTVDLNISVDRSPEVSKKLGALISVLLLEYRLFRENPLIFGHHAYASIEAAITALSEYSPIGNGFDKAHVCSLVCWITQNYNLNKASLSQLNQLETVLNSDTINSILREQKRSSSSDTDSYTLVWGMVKYARLRLAIFSLATNTSTDFLDAHLSRSSARMEDALSDLLIFLLALNNCIDTVLGSIDAFSSRLESYCKNIMPTIIRFENCLSDADTKLLPLIAAEMKAVISKIRHSQLYAYMRELQFELYLKLPSEHGALFSDRSCVQQRLEDFVQEKIPSVPDYFNYLNLLLLEHSLQSRLDTVSSLDCSASRFPDMQKKLNALVSILSLEKKIVRNAICIDTNKEQSSSIVRGIIELKKFSPGADLLQDKGEICRLVYSITQNYNLNKENLNELESVLKINKVNTTLRTERSRLRLQTSSGANTKSYAMVWSMVKLARLRLAVFTNEGISTDSTLRQRVFRYPHQNSRQKKVITSLVRGLTHSR